MIALYFIFFFVTKPAKETTLFAEASNLTDTLPDGSVITLKKGSTLSFSAHPDKEIRRVQLSGEAWFSVEKDSNRPFVVEAGPAQVRVLGTAFFVKMSKHGKGDWVETVVTVESGRVLLFRIGKTSGDTTSLTLDAGMRGRFVAGNEKPELDQSGVPDELFWKDRSLNFRQARLDEVFSMLEKYYLIKVSVGNQGILKCRITASFLDEKPEQILRVIAASFNLELTVKEGIFLLEGAGCL